MLATCIRIAVPTLLLTSIAIAQEGQAVYELVHDSTWSSTTHPTNFPRNPHYSGLIGGTHNNSVSFWRSGGIATPGIEAMAETGGTFALRNEVNAAITAGTAKRVVSGGAIGFSPGSYRMRFTIDASHPRLTLVSMLAPSPDWFVGVSGLELRRNGRWVDTLNVPLHLYDAGTDSGTTYTSPNRDTQPRERIARITTASGPFAGRSTIVGSFMLRRITASSVYGCGVNPAGSLTVDAPALLGTNLGLTVNDPTGSMARGSQSLVVLGTTGNFPCGTRIPGFGMRSGTDGELLVGGIAATLAGPNWNGSAVRVGLSIPNNSVLQGGVVYAQGALFGGGRVGLADAAELHTGR